MKKRSHAIPGAGISIEMKQVVDRFMLLKHNLLVTDSRKKTRFFHQGRSKLAKSDEAADASKFEDGLESVFHQDIEQYLDIQGEDGENEKGSNRHRSHCEASYDSSEKYDYSAFYSSVEQEEESEQELR